MSRLKKSIISICVAVCMCFLSVCSFSINSHAAGEVYLPYPEPSTSDSQGYVVLGIDMDGTREYVTFHWALSSENLTQSTVEKLPMNIYISQNSISFTCNFDTSDSYYTTGYIGYYNYEGVYRVMKSFDLSNKGSTSFTHNFSSGIVVKSYFVRGAIGALTVPYSTVIPGKVVFLGGVSGSELLSVLNQVVSGTVDINTYLRANIPTINGYLKSIDSDVSVMTPLLQDYLPYIQYIFTFLDNNIENVLNTISYRLGTIIEDLGVQSAEDKQASDEFTESAQSQSNALNQATQESQTEKVDPNAAAGTIDGNLDFNAVNDYSNVLVVVTNNSTVVTMMLIVMCVALISYVLFGKR